MSLSVAGCVLSAVTYVCRSFSRVSTRLPSVVGSSAVIRQLLLAGFMGMARFHRVTVHRHTHRVRETTLRSYIFVITDFQIYHLIH